MVVCDSHPSLNDGELLPAESVWLCQQLLVDDCRVTNSLCADEYGACKEGIYLCSG
jgi:hypothetical protein